MDNFSRRFAGNGPVHFVLNSFEEVDADIHGRIIIDTGGVNVCNFLIKTTFRCSNILNPPFEFFKVIKRQIRVLLLIIPEEI